MSWEGEQRGEEGTQREKCERSEAAKQATRKTGSDNETKRLQRLPWPFVCNARVSVCVSDLSVRSRQHDHSLRGSHSVHFDQQLIERILALVIAAAIALLAARTTNGVDLILTNDNNGRGGHTRMSSRK